MSGMPSYIVSAMLLPSRSSLSSSITRSSDTASGMSSPSSYFIGAVRLPIIFGASLASVTLTVTSTSAVSPLGSMART